MYNMDELEVMRTWDETRMRLQALDLEYIFKGPANCKPVEIVISERTQPTPYVATSLTDLLVFLRGYETGRRSETERREV